MAQPLFLPSRRIVLAAWILLGLVLALAFTPAVIGSFLGDDYVGEADTVIAREPALVWAAVVDAQRYPVNSSAVLRVLDLDDEDGMPCWEEEMNRSSSVVCVRAREEARREVREVVSLEGDMVAQWVLELEPVERGTALHLRQDVHVDSTGLFGAHLRFALSFLDNAEVAPSLYLERLRRELEAE
ncbi:MAG: hypothetical protein H6828_12830 [Planctomycetes bacterium]|nr:hypothetical protein [Planctomycetota bacterium]